MAPSRALDLCGMVDYGAGAVVSRTLKSGAAGTITLFAFDEGQELSEHSAPYDAFVQIIEGAAMLRIGGEDVGAKTGEVIIMPANVPHAVQGRGRFKMLLVMIRS